MKNLAKVFVLIAVACLGTMSFAAIKGPTGLAVDSKGNLYVANFTTNKIFVFAPAHNRSQPGPLPLA